MFHAAGLRLLIYIMVVLASVAFLLHGCKMGPDYTRPETPKSDSWRVTASTAESIANLPWWELLKDQELQRLVRMVLEENLDLQIAAACLTLAGIHLLVWLKVSRSSALMCL